MKAKALIAIGILEFCGYIVLAQSAGSSNANALQSGTSPAKAVPSKAPPQSDVGEKKFQQNCSRCHNAPQELSRRISGTVVMHMRARASLSTADERAILRYLVP